MGRVFNRCPKATLGAVLDDSGVPKDRLCQPPACHSGLDRPTPQASPAVSEVRSRRLLREGVSLMPRQALQRQTVLLAGCLCLAVEVNVKDCGASRTTTFKSVLNIGRTIERVAAGREGFESEGPRGVLWRNLRLGPFW